MKAGGWDSGGLDRASCVSCGMPVCVGGAWGDGKGRTDAQHVLCWGTAGVCWWWCLYALVLKDRRGVGGHRQCPCTPLLCVTVGLKSSAPRWCIGLTGLTLPFLGCLVRVCVGVWLPAAAQGCHRQPVPPLWPVMPWVVRAGLRRHVLPAYAMMQHMLTLHAFHTSVATLP